MRGVIIDLPPYVSFTDAEEKFYQQDLNQTLRDGLSDNGWTVPQVSDDELRVNLVQNPATGALTTLAQLMPDGTIWMLADKTATPPVGLAYIGKLNGSLVQFTTTAYP